MKPVFYFPALNINNIVSNFKERQETFVKPGKISQGDYTA